MGLTVQAMVKSELSLIDCETETVEEVVSKLKSSLTSREKTALKFILPYAKRGVAQRELGKVIGCTTCNSSLLPLTTAIN